MAAVPPGQAGLKVAVVVTVTSSVVVATVVSSVTVEVAVVIAVVWAVVSEDAVEASVTVFVMQTRPGTEGETASSVAQSYVSVDVVDVVRVVVTVG